MADEESKSMERKKSPTSFDVMVVNSHPRMMLSYCIPGTGKDKPEGYQIMLGGRNPHTNLTKEQYEALQHTVDIKDGLSLQLLNKE